MKKSDELRLLEKVGAVLTDDHFVFASGKHGSVYVNKDAVYPHPELISLLCWTLVEKCADLDPDVVIAPAIGGVVLSHLTATHISQFSGRKVLSVYAEQEKNGDAFVIKQGYDKLMTGKRVFVVEDILTTGGSVKKVVEASRAIGSYVVGVGALCNRGGVTAADVGGVPRLVVLVNLPLDAWNEADCPLCKEGKPINTDVGKGREFLARKKAS